MKILILNGSPRKKGNTAAAVSAFIAAAGDHEIDVCNVTGLTIHPCVNCDVCQSNGGKCARPDDTNTLLDKIISADAVIFATPVYWWGMTAQLKTAIDKLYARVSEIQDAKDRKKIGIISIGGDGLDNPQYRLIADQFGYICDYLKWEVMFNHPVSAHKAYDLANAPAELKKIAALAQAL